MINEKDLTTNKLKSLVNSPTDSNITFTSDIFDIKGNKIGVGKVVRDEYGLKYQFDYDKSKNEWFACSLSENNRVYPMNQNRINRNGFVLI